MPDQVIDEVGDNGIVLADGTPLSYLRLSKILTELASPSLLKEGLPYVRTAHSDVATHIASTFKEAGRILKAISEFTPPPKPSLKKVICLDNYGWEGDLTIGKEYPVLKESPAQNFSFNERKPSYFIKNDEGWEIWFVQTRFKDAI